ncbi:MAG: RNA methyltransferase [Anaerolineae bacterium]|nr:RNA methyltransferase [Thermoflexales bacterium]MDW8406637.1 RNA methyltransferase [Anaerolineae bacterium]
MIVSPQNPRVKLARRLQQRRDAREAEGLFVAEGTRLVDDLAAAGMQIAYAIVADRPTAHAWCDRYPQVDRLLVSDHTMRGLSTEVTPPGVLAVFHIPKTPSLHLFEQAPILLILDALKEPGNLGACLRVAAGADCRHVLLSPGCVDLYNPKVVRGAMGAHARILARQCDWPDMRTLCAGRPVWAADAAGAHDYDAMDWRRPSALILGGEAEGVSSEARDMASGAVRIPLANRVESLNVAVACGVILFEIARQRRAS